MTESDSVTCIKDGKEFTRRKRHLPSTAYTTSYGPECSELVQVATEVFISMLKLTHEVLSL